MAELSPRLEALLLLVGTIIGVGIFVLPFVFGQAGFLTGLVELAVLAAAVTLVHLAYAEVVLRTAAVHRLPGYVRMYLGRSAGWLATASYVFGLSGALLVYLVLGGSFLAALIQWALPSSPAIAGPLLFYLIGIVVIFRGIRFEAFSDALLTFGLVVALVLLAVLLWPDVSASFLTTFRPEGFILPYGVILFALAGAAIVPDLKRVLGRPYAASLGRIVIAGTLVSAALYLIFASSVLGATGEATTPDAITGLGAKFGALYLLLGNAIGVLAAISSFIALGVVFEGMLVSDFKFRPRLAWLATAAIPLSLFGLGFHDFITVIGAVGAVGIGLDSVFILLVHRRAAAAAGPAPAFQMRIPFPLRALLVFMFAAGVVLELITIAR